MANDARRFHIYVANRVQVIRDVSSAEDWHHVKSENNPADYASRGCTAKQLAETNWFTGPSFLWQKELRLKEPDSQYEVSTEDPEVRKVVNVSHVKRSLLVEYFGRFSSWRKLVRCVAIWLKLRDVLRRKTMQQVISVEDRRKAEEAIVRVVQQEEYKDSKIESIQRGHVLYKLDVFRDQAGLVRVGGRLRSSNEDFEVKHPAVLPKNNHISVLVVRNSHEQVHHQGRGITLNHVRSSGFWIIGARRIVSSVIHKCVMCRRLRGPVSVQKMADLPADRTVDAPPFTYVGVDLFGPFQVKERRSIIKRYGVIFTCMASRAIHLEVANDLTTDSFINALRRFIAVRGPIRQLRSDQGTNFVGAKNELKLDDAKKFLDEVGCDIFTWKFNPPGGSHMGGVWERQIRTVRSVLQALLEKNSQQLDDESLRTFMTEVMAIVNGRPLTYDLDSVDLMPLNPNMMLTGKSSVVKPPPGIFQREDMYVRRRWRRVQHLADQFWQRWRKEYLQTLQVRPKWSETKINVREGDVVIIRDDNLPRNQWLLGRVEEAKTSDDDLVRQAKVRLATKWIDRKGQRMEEPRFLERPISKLVLLVKQPQEEDSPSTANV